MTNAKRPSFLFLHGAGGTKSKWRRQKAFFQDDGAIYLDLPGHGANKEPQKTTIESYADWVARTITDDVIVVGHSMGGLIGIELAATSSKVKGLILTASHYEMPVHPNVLAKLAEGVFPESFFYASYSKQAPEALIAEEKEEQKLNPVSVRKVDLEACDQYKEGKNRISALQKPVLAVYGVEDRLVPKDAEEKLLAANPNVETKTITAAGHYVMLERPDEYNDAIVEFQHNI